VPRWSYTYRAPCTFIACTDTTLSFHKQKHGKVETRVEIKEKVRQEKKRKKCSNRRNSYPDAETFARLEIYAETTTPFSSTE